MDAVTINGTAGADAMSLTGGGGSVTDPDRPCFVIAIMNAEPANDTLTIKLERGRHRQRVGPGDTSVHLTLNGGTDNDILVGQLRGNDTINGDAGNDTATVAPGSTLAASTCETSVNIP